MSSDEKTEATVTTTTESAETIVNDADNNTKESVSTTTAAAAETVETAATAATTNNSDAGEEETKEESVNNNIPSLPSTSSAASTTHRKWVLWYDNPRFAEQGQTWLDNVKQCGTINTSESLWRIYNNVKPITQLPLNSNYHLFKEGVAPMWEDPENIDGGKFVLTVPKKETRAGKLEDWWLYTILAIIGESMDVGGDMICGAVLSTRKAQDRIALWLKTDDKDKCMEIGLKWKKAMEIEDHRKMTVKYQLHKEAAAAGCSFKNEIKFEL